MTFDQVPGRGASLLCTTILSIPPTTDQLKCRFQYSIKNTRILLLDRVLKHALPLDRFWRHSYENEPNVHGSLHIHTQKRRRTQNRQYSSPENPRVIHDSVLTPFKRTEAVFTYALGTIEENLVGPFPDMLRSLMRMFARCGLFLCHVKVKLASTDVSIKQLSLLGQA